MISFFWYCLLYSLFNVLRFLLYKYFTYFFLCMFAVCIKENYWFCVLIFYLAAWRNVLISYRSFLLEPLGFSMCGATSSENENSLVSSFLIDIPILSSCLTALIKTSGTEFDESGESRYPCLIPNCSGNVLSFSLFSRMVAVGLLSTGFIAFFYGPLISSFFYIFMKAYYTLLKAFCANKTSVWFLCLSLLTWWITLIDSCIPASFGWS